MWFIVILSIAGIAIVAGVGYLIIKRSSGNLHPSMYWLNRNKYNSDLLELQNRIKKQEQDFKIVKKIIGIVVNCRNNLKRVILEAEALESLLKKSSRVIRSEFDEIILLQKSLISIQHELQNNMQHIEQSDPEFKILLNTLQEELIAANHNIEILLDPNMDKSVVVATLTKCLESLKNSYDRIVKLHTQFIEYYHDSFSIAL